MYIPATTPEGSNEFPINKLGRCLGKIGAKSLIKFKKKRTSRQTHNLTGSRFHEITGETYFEKTPHWKDPH